MMCHMEYTYKFDESTGICMVRVTGRHRRPHDSMVLQKFARDFGSECACQKFLFDMRQADIIGDGTMDIYKTGTVPVDPDRNQINQRIALLYKSILNDHKFMEDVAVNRGYQLLRVFGQVNKALEWLGSTKDNS